MNSIETIILGKKAYFDQLELIKDGEKYYKNHIREKAQWEGDYQSYSDQKAVSCKRNVQEE